MQAVHTLNYQYASRRNQIHIGCIMSLTYSYSDPYFNDILNGIQSFCSRHNALISLIVSYAQFQEMKAGLEKQLSELDGLIITDVWILSAALIKSWSLLTITSTVTAM